MPTVCPVKFPFAARDLWFDAFDLEIDRGSAVICQTARGTERGVATGSPEEWDEERLDQTLGGEALAPILRLSTAADDAEADRLERLSKDAMAVFREAVEAHGLPMKPVGVEYLFGLERVVCYFMAEGRVDFRNLARDLSQRLDMRVDMHQLGDREQSAIMGGIAHCGQEFCCSRLGQGFGAVTIRMAKDQDLPLSSPKISGACGRLMCCLRYENEAYREFKGRAPKKNARVQTPMGEARVAELDTPREAVTLRLENGKSIKVPLASMERSEAAQEQAQRNGCVCRPDCVTREALAKLDSPQVRLALAQLEAEEELENEELLAPEDRIIDEEPKGQRRRRRKGAGGEAGHGEAGEVTTRRRRHRRPAGEAAGSLADGVGDGAARGASSAEGAPGDAASPEAEGATRRRSRRRGSRGRGRGVRAEGATPEQPEAGASAEAPGQGAKRRSRRRKTKAQEGAADAKGEAKAQGKAASEGAEGAKPKRRRSRRRGKGGKGAEGAAGPQNAKGGAAGGSEGARGASPKGQGGTGNAGAKASGGAEAGDRKPGRSRRRHRRRGSAEGGTPAGASPAGGTPGE